MPYFVFRRIHGTSSRRRRRHHPIAIVSASTSTSPFLISFFLLLVSVLSLSSSMSTTNAMNMNMMSMNRNRNRNRNVNLNRAKFLASTAAAFASGVAGLSGFMVANSNSEECEAAVIVATGSSSNNNNYNDNPRYIEREIDMNMNMNMNMNGGSNGEDKNNAKNNPRSRGILVRRITGDSTPYSFPVTPIRLVKEWPEEYPFQQEDFLRADSNDDGWFYKVPRLVYHIDEPAVASLTQYYRSTILPKSDILDICSSWVSHYPLEFPNTMNSIKATGMSGMELQFNDQLSKNDGYEASDLNVNPKLPYQDESFDVVTCVVSIDYLIEPIKVLQECHRVLRPGGKVIISQSNRCFPSKAIAMWLQMNDRQHLELINGYFQYAGGFQPRNAYDITATLPDNGYRDPMFIIEAVKGEKK